MTMQRIGCKDGDGTVLGNLGALYNSLGEYAKARQFYEKALTISRDTRDQKGEMTMNINLGSLHLSQNEFQKALSCFEKALRISEQVRDLHGKSISYCHIAAVYMVQLDIPKALSHLSAGIKILEEMQLSVRESEYFKMGFADKNAVPYRPMIALLVVKLKCVNMALSILELAHARSLAELMATQYFSQQLPRFDSNRWNDFANVVQTKSCTCL